MLEKRIQNLVNTSETIINNYPNSADAAKQEISNVKQKWQDFLKDAKNTRILINLANEYFTLYNHVSINFHTATFCTI